MTTKFISTYLLCFLTHCVLGQVDLKDNFSEYYKNTITTVHLDSNEIGKGCGVNAAYLVCLERRAKLKYKLDTIINKMQSCNLNSPDSLICVIKIKEMKCKNDLASVPNQYIISKKHRFCDLIVGAEYIKINSQTRLLDKRKTYYYLEK